MDTKNLFDKLFRSSKESEVSYVLEQYSEDSSIDWHPYGDNESFFGVIENQQASAIPALVEKLTNSIDAILMKKCLEAGFDPKSAKAPQSVDEAIISYFSNSPNWDLSKNRQLQAEDIQILADGSYKDRNKDTSLIIYDNGEGQHPKDFSDTFLSLLRGNKNEIHFVQGKYNMGGSGAIVFCGKQRYQLMASRRFDGTGDFGFTLIRKHPLSDAEKKTKKNTWYEYLTVNNDIPSFKLPDEGIDLGLYHRNFTTGTVIKLYSYNLPSGSRSVISRDLNQSINEYLFQPALPVYTIDSEERYPKDRNLHRDLFGLKHRLDSDDNKYISETFSEEIQDSEIGTYKVTVYVFNHRIEGKSIKESKAAIRREFFKNNMSVIFSLNGQVHGNYTSEFVTRSLKFNLLKDYLLIHVDCTKLEMDFRSELFMASRDRLKNGEESAMLRKKLSSYLKKKNGRLDEIYHKRKQELAANTGSTSSLLKDFSENLPFDSDLMKLINHTFDLKEKGGSKSKKKQKNMPSQTQGKEEQPFSPKRFPTSFKIDTKSKKDAIPVIQIPINGDKTIKFSTDVEDQYFDRTDENGELQIAILKPKKNDTTGGDKPGEPKDIQGLLSVNKSSPNKGTIRVNINPSKETKVGSQFTVKAKLTSPGADLEQIFIVKILDKKTKQDHKSQQEEQPSQLGLPKLVEVYKEKTDNNTSWGDINYIDFDYDTVMYPYLEEDKLESIFINMDSTIIKNHMGKLRNEDELNLSKRRYLSSVYFHTLFLYMINKNKGIQISESSEASGKNEELELPDYLMKIFDGSYTEFLMNFEVSALMESLSD
ncbi:MAG: Unknown protein [uncultured Thiotrichaceae bacterium]|uniref:Uncharacterized protein n=1 Tax=uncultured Thiotrichaceae bacterium TaxID=298394 RepID=A0A6S6UCG8_9GAMM|nr:MAG: Unknown protein [uncultured Thiotrichaceae bacterium]